LATARVANCLADKMELRNGEEIAVAGLLHDLGKVIIAQRFPNENREIRQKVESDGGLQVDAERAVLGVTHGEIGLWLLRKWGLPDKLLYPIAYHHAFHHSRDFADRTAIVHVADILCRARGIGYAGDHRIPALNHEAWEMLGLSMSDVDEIYQQLDSEF
jgi:putative nucleotidyltransferase with HDIG domain